MSVQRTRRTGGNSARNTDKNSSAFSSVAWSGGIFPRLRQISVLSRACKFLIRVRVVLAKSSELTSASLRKPGNIKLIRSAQAASIARREGKVAAASRVVKSITAIMRWVFIEQKRNYADPAEALYLSRLECLCVERLKSLEV